MATLGLDIGLRALLTSRSALDTIGHNLANASTPGYSRQSLEVSTSRTMLLRGLALGSGVQADVVRRTTDALLVRRMIGQTSSLARLDARTGGLSEIEALLGEPGSSALGQRLAELFGSFSSLANDPSESALRSGVAQSAVSLTDQLHQLAASLGTIRSDTAEQARAQVEEVNSLTRRLFELNRQVRELESRRVPANDLRDQRELLLGELAGRLDISYHEDSTGLVRVSTQGQLLVGSAGASRVELEEPAAGTVRLRIEGATQTLVPRGGTLGALAELAAETIPGYQDGLDALARGLILGVNQAHGTALPPSGPFRQLTAAFAFADHDEDGELLDERLADSGLVFAIEEGELFVNVQDLAGGAFRTTRIEIDPERTTVGELVGALGAIEGLSASLDSTGRLKILADAGVGFDFSKRLNTAPDPDGTFGGGRASLVLGAGEPYALADLQTLDLVGGAGPFSVTFSAGDFATIGEASAAELAAALNADPGLAAGGLRAVVVGDRVALQSQGAGAGESFTVAGGSALGALGLVAGTVVDGHDLAASVTLDGEHQGAANQEYTFLALGDGTIGSTPGLLVEVRDAGGALVAVLDVGQGYQPGSALAFGDGLSVRFGLGELSATHGDRFVARALAESDSAGVVGALGLNAFFVGTGAADVALRADLASDPAGIATGLGGGAGDNRGALALAAVAEERLTVLDGRTVSGAWGDVVADLGFQSGSARDALEMERFLMDGLIERREQISGVDVDRELVDMLREEQSFAAASQYIQVVQQTLDELLNLI
jgi:flagellar hook-associated protein FlgK